MNCNPGGGPRFNPPGQVRQVGDYLSQAGGCAVGGSPIGLIGLIDNFEKVKRELGKNRSSWALRIICPTCPTYRGATIYAVLPIMTFEVYLSYLSGKPPLRTTIFCQFSGSKRRKNPQEIQQPQGLERE